MYEDAIKIDPRFADAYYGKGLLIIFIKKRKFSLQFIKVLTSH